MKRTNLILLAVLCLFTVSCKEEKVEILPMEITLETLQQTWWRGSFTQNGEEAKSYPVDVIFETKEVGLCGAVSPDDTPRHLYYFDYSVEGKLITIRLRSADMPEEVSISGKWWIISSNSKLQSLKLRREPYFPKDGAALELTKIELK